MQPHFSGGHVVGDNHYGSGPYKNLFYSILFYSCLLSNSYEFATNGLHHECHCLKRNASGANPPTTAPQRQPVRYLPSDDLAKRLNTRSLPVQRRPPTLMTEFTTLAAPPSNHHEPYPQRASLPRNPEIPRFTIPQTKGICNTSCLCVLAH